MPRAQTATTERKELWKAYGQPGEQKVPHVNFEGTVAVDHEQDPLTAIEEFGDGSVILTVFAYDRDEAVANWRSEADQLAQA